MKYLILRTEDDRLVPIIFPNFLVHSEVAKYLGHMLNRVHDWKNEPASAGDIHFSDVTCSGKSETLKLVSNPADADLIESYDYNHGSSDTFMNAFLKTTMAKARREAQETLNE